MTAYSFTDLRIKSMQIKGERPVIVILSGAGLSAESGIPTYRNADNNWNRTDSMDSVDMKHRPQLVFDSINRRIEAYDQAKPNAAHLSIAEFKKKWRNRPTSSTSHRTSTRCAKKRATRVSFTCTDRF